MLPPTYEIRVMCKVIRSSDIDLDFTFWESVRDSILVCGSRCGGDDTLVYITRLCKIKCLRIKFIYILTAGGMDFSIFSVLSVVWYRFFGSADQSSRRGLLCFRVCVYVRVYLCLCVCVWVFVILNLCYIACDQKNEWSC